MPFIESPTLIQSEQDRLRVFLEENRIAPPEQTDPESPGLGATFAAAGRTQNTLGSFVTNRVGRIMAGYSPLYGGQMDFDRDFDPSVQLSDPEFYIEHPYALNGYERLAAAKDAGEFDLTLQQLRQVQDDFETVAAAGWSGVPISLAVNIADPTNLIPYGLIARTAKGVGTAKLIQNVAKAAAIGATANVLQEEALRGISPGQPIDRAEADLVAAGFGIVFGGTIGFLAAPNFKPQSGGGLTSMGADLAPQRIPTAKLMKIRERVEGMFNEPSEIGGLKPRNFVTAIEDSEIALRQMLKEKPEEGRSLAVLFRRDNPEAGIEADANGKLVQQIQHKYDKAGIELNIERHPLQDDFDAFSPLERSLNDAAVTVRRLESESTGAKQAQPVDVADTKLQRAVAEGNTFLAKAAQVLTPARAFEKSILDLPNLLQRTFLYDGTISRAGLSEGDYKGPVPAEALKENYTAIKDAAIREIREAYDPSRELGMLFSRDADDSVSFTGFQKVAAKFKRKPIEYVNAAGERVTIPAYAHYTRFGQEAVNILREQKAFDDGFAAENLQKVPPQLQKAVDAIRRFNDEMLDLGDQAGVLPGPRSLADAQARLDKAAEELRAAEDEFRKTEGILTEDEMRRAIDDIDSRIDNVPPDEAEALRTRRADLQKQLDDLQDKVATVYSNVPKELKGRVLFDWGSKGLRIEGSQGGPIRIEGQRARSFWDNKWNRDLKRVHVPNPQIVRALREVTDEIWPVLERRGKFWSTRYYLAPEKAIQQAEQIAARKARSAAEGKLMAAQQKHADIEARVQHLEQFQADAHNYFTRRFIRENVLDNKDGFKSYLKRSWQRSRNIGTDPDTGDIIRLNDADRPILDEVREQLKIGEEYRTEGDLIATDKKALDDQILQAPINENGIDLKTNTNGVGRQITNLIETEKSLPPVRDGMTRLFRAESPTVKFHDVFDVNKLTDYAPGGLKGKYYTKTLGTADYYRESLGKDATIKYVDVPTSLISDKVTSKGDYIVDVEQLSQQARSKVSTGISNNPGLDEAAASSLVNLGIKQDESSVTPKYRDASGEIMLFQGVRAGNVDGKHGQSGFYTQNPKLAMLYAAHEGGGGVIRIIRASDLPESVYTDKHGNAVSIEQYLKDRDTVGIATSVISEPPARSEIQADRFSVDGGESPDLHARYAREVDAFFERSAESTWETITDPLNGHGVDRAFTNPSPLMHRRLTLDESDPSAREFLDADPERVLSAYLSTVGGRIANQVAIERAEPLLKAAGLETRVTDRVQRGEKLIDQGERLVRPDELIDQLRDRYNELANSLEAVDREAGTGHATAVKRDAQRVLRRLGRRVENIEGRGIGDPTSGANALATWGGRQLLSMNYLALLGSQTLAAVNDAAGITLFTDITSVPKNVRYMLKAMAPLKKAARRDLELMRLAFEGEHARVLALGDVDFDNAMGGVGFGRTRQASAAIGAGTQHLSAAFNELSLINSWNRYIKRAAAMIAMDRFVTHSRRLIRANALMAKGTKLDDALRQVGLSRFDYARLRDVGINAESARQMLGLIRKYGTDENGNQLANLTDNQWDNYKGLALPNAGEWLRLEGDKVRAVYDTYLAAINGQVEHAMVITPTLQDKPLINDHWWGRAINQFQQFNMSWANQVARPLAQRPAGRQMAGVLAYFGTGALVDAIRNHLSSRRDFDETARLWMDNPLGMTYAVVNTSGLSGWFNRPLAFFDKVGWGPGAMLGNQDIARAAYQSRTFWGSLSPSADFVDRTLYGAMGVASGDPSLSHWHALRKSVPMQNLIWFRLNSRLTGIDPLVTEKLMQQRYEGEEPRP